MTAAFLGAILILAGGSSSGSRGSLAESMMMPVVFIVCAIAFIAWVYAPLVLIAWIVPQQPAWLWLSLVWYLGCLNLPNYFAKRRTRLKPLLAAFDRAARR